MFLYYLKGLENSLLKKEKKRRNILKAIISLKEIFLDVDFKNEAIPMSSLENIIELAEKIKKAKLSKNEKKVLSKILK